MIVLHYNTAFKALDTYVKTYNQKNADNLAKQVRQSVTATAKELIRIYGVSLLKSNGVGEVDPDNLPSLRTNNVQLAKLSNSSTRTVKRHINKLIDAGIITEKVWHGSNASYELWINPKILLVSEKPSKKKAQELLDEVIRQAEQKAQNEQVENQQVTIRPNTESCNTSNTNNIIIEVHKQTESGALEPDQDEMTAAVTGNKLIRCELPLTGSVDDSGNTTGNISGNTGENIAKKNKGAGGNKRVLRADSKKREMNAPDDEARTASLNLYVKMLWILAKNVLYRDIFLTERQVSTAKKLLRRWYEPVADHHLSRVHQIYVERIALARKFVAKNPEKRFIQLPNRYFDPTNTGGFAGTKVWWHAQEKRKQEVQIKLILNAQIRRFINNEKKSDATKKPSLELFRDCEQRIGKLGNPMLLDQFHAAILNPISKSNLHGAHETITQNAAYRSNSAIFNRVS